MPPAIDSFVDNILLAFVLTPILYRFSFLPLIRANQSLEARTNELAGDIKHQQDHLIALAPDPIVTLTPMGFIKTLNKAAEKISGFQADELIGKHFAKIGIVTAQFLPKAVSEFGLLILGNDRPPYEIEIRHKEGNVLPLEVHGHLVQHADEKDKDLLLILRNISERKKADAALRESEERYRALAESAHDNIFLVDIQERLQYINPFGAAWFKASKENLIGKTMKEIFPESYQKIKTNFQTILRTKESLFLEEELTFPSGQVFLDTQITPMFDEKGEIYCFTGIARNITARKHSEARIKLQAEALEAASNGIAITDTHGTIQWVNAAFTRMTGYSFEEAVGKNPRILKSGEQSHKAYQELWATILSGSTWVGELINRRKDGSLYFEKQTITPVKNSSGEMTHFIAIKEDISADKKLEAQFRQAQKMEAVGRLAGGVAHDFNNLLTIILGRSDLLLEHLGPQDASRHGIEEIRQSGKRAASLTQQLLAFSRRQLFQIKITDLNEIVRGADRMLRRLVGEDVEVVTLFGENLKPVKVDSAQIEQVLMNLAVNARDAMPNGGKLFIETSRVEVDSKTAARYPGFVPGEYLRLKVQDTGCGISPEVKAHLFEPFFTTKEQGKGTGLGLATIYGIVKQSKGFIYLESDNRKGSEFMIFLPPSEQKITPVENIQNFPDLPKGDEKILIAEDEELVRSLAVQVLARQGFHTLEAGNGLEALRVAQANQGEPIQLLITDMVMPFMGGHELAEKFSAAYPKAKIIFISGYTDHTAVQKWIDRGCHFLQKPYTHAELLIAVGEALLDKK